MSAKYELDGYRPLKPKVRGVSYLAFIITTVLVYIRIQPDVPPMTSLILAAAWIVTFVMAICSFADARTSARLRRKGARKIRVVPGFAQPQFTFFEREAEWDYYNDAEPTTLSVTS